LFVSGNLTENKKILIQFVLFPWPKYYLKIKFCVPNKGLKSIIIILLTLIFGSHIPLDKYASSKLLCDVD